MQMSDARIFGGGPMQCARFLDQFGVLVLFAKVIFNYYKNSMQLEVHASLLVDIIMRRQTRDLSVLAAIAALVCGFAVASAEAQAPEKMKAQTVSLGIVTQLDRTRMADQFSDFVRYVAAKLSSGSDIKGKVVIAATSFELARLIEQRQVDFYMESPYPTHLINNVQGVAKLRLRRWKGGKAEYQSLIFTKRDGEINRLDDLRGKVLAFEDPESTSGHFLPKSFLIRKGFKFTDKNRYDLYASPTDIGYLFAYSQENLVNWVLTKKAAAAAFSDDDYARLGGNRAASTPLSLRSKGFFPGVGRSPREDIGVDARKRARAENLKKDRRHHKVRPSARRRCGAPAKALRNLSFC